MNPEVLIVEPILDLGRVADGPVQWNKNMDDHIKAGWTPSSDPFAPGDGHLYRCFSKVVGKSPQ